jgi:sugar O-acyltransferase (sialic acid O-acetyltransferase NeuD family)
VQKVVILGAGGFAREVLWLLRDANAEKLQWDILGFIDEDVGNHGKVLCDLPVLGDFEFFKGAAEAEVKLICGVGSPKIKKHFVKKAKEMGLSFCSVIHPSARMSRYVDIGEGTLIAANSIITTQVKVGACVTVNLNCTVGHDCIIEDYCTIAPGTSISGNVTLKEGVDLGSQSVILQGLTVGRWSTIGAGGVVIEDVPESVTAVGVPAKVKISAL